MSLDPIGTIRRESHDGGHSIWVRIPPGYPDDQFLNTEWTCIESTAEGNVGKRKGAGEIEVHQIPVVGQIPFTVAESGLDVEEGARVRILVEEQAPEGTIVAISEPYSLSHRNVDCRSRAFVVQLDGNDAKWRFTRWEFEVLPAANQECDPA